MARLAVFTILLLALALAHASKSKKVLCYYKNTGTYRNSPCTYTKDHEGISAQYCTHLVYYWANLDEEGNVSPSDPWSDLTSGGGKGGYEKINALKNENKNLTTILNVGADTMAKIYKKVASTASLRATFTTNLVDFVKEYGFDGAIVDFYLYPSTEEDQENYVSLIESLRAAFDKNILTLGVSADGAAPRANKIYNPKALNMADFVSVYAFFYRDVHNHGVAHPSPLYKCKEDTYPMAEQETVDYVMTTLFDQVKPEKMIVAAYGDGRAYTAADPTHTGLGDKIVAYGNGLPCTQIGGVANYDETCDSSWSPTFYDSCKMELASKGNQIAARESPRSVAAKAEYAKNFGGIMLYNGMDGDDFDGSCGIKQDLLKIMHETLMK